MWKALWKLMSARWQTYIALALPVFEGKLRAETSRLTVPETKALICRWIQDKHKWPGTLRGIACKEINRIDAGDVDELFAKLRKAAGLPA